MKSPTYDANNIFAKIIRGEAPCVKVHEDDRIMCFMDVFPQSTGHCLVVHKRETATDLLSISAEALAEITIATQRITKAVNAALNPDGIRIVQFNGRSAGQTVFHLHFHIIPVFDGERLSTHAGGDAATPEQLAPIARKIADHL